MESESPFGPRVMRGVDDVVSATEHVSDSNPKSARTDDQAANQNAPVRDAPIESAEKWLALYGDALFQFALNRTGDNEVAEDLVQETLLAAFERHDTFRRQASTSTWLFAILRRKIADYFRGLGRSMSGIANETSEMDTPRGGRSWDDDPAKICQNAEFRTTFENCLEKLPDKLADVFVLREMNQYAPREIRELLGINATTLSMRLHRCRQALRDCLNQNWFQSK